MHHEVTAAAPDTDTGMAMDKLAVLNQSESTMRYSKYGDSPKIQQKVLSRGKSDTQSCREWERFTYKQDGIFHKDADGRYSRLPSSAR